VASLSQGRTAAAQCGLFTHKSVPVIFEPPCIFHVYLSPPCKNCFGESLMLQVVNARVGLCFPEQ